MQTSHQNVPSSIRSAAGALRLAGLSDDPNDYVFQCNGVDVGRCYGRLLTNRETWSWSIYIAMHVKRTVEGEPL
jgi:hypothetical protein